jgi:DNA (cytosine-5)-methyltransferase 1
METFPNKTPAISARMRKVHSADTTPETLFRKALWAKGVRYKTSPSNIPGKPDVALPSHRIAIFIDGNFWHDGQWKKRNLSCLEEQFSKNPHQDYWIQKIRGNARRDCSNTSVLLDHGWTVIRFWEDEIQRDLEKCVAVTLETIKNGKDFNPISLLPRMTFADFFAGIGLFRIGLEKQGWTSAFANDIDQQKFEIYRQNFHNDHTPYICEDIYQLPPELIPSVSLATASFPCTDLSIAGARKGLKGKHSSAFWGFISILEKKGHRRPPLVMLENVVGFLTSHGGDDFTQALLALNRLGYEVDAFIINASHFVPQSRQRLFVVAQLGEFGNSSLKKNLDQFTEDDVRPHALITFMKNHPEIKWNIRKVPSLPQNGHSLESILEDFSATSPEWWNEKRANYLLNQMSPRHQSKADEMISSPAWSYGTVFRRMRNGKSMAELRTDGIAGCLRTPKGGSARQILFKAGKGKFFVRLMTAREAARLMGVGDYNFSVPLNQALFGFGDAVCVPVIEWIAKYYLNPLVNELIHSCPLILNNAGVQYATRK